MRPTATAAPGTTEAERELPSTATSWADVVPDRKTSVALTFWTISVECVSEIYLPVSLAKSADFVLGLSVGLAGAHPLREVPYQAADVLLLIRPVDKWPEPHLAKCGSWSRQVVHPHCHQLMVLLDPLLFRDACFTGNGDSHPRSRTQRHTFHCQKVRSGHPICWLGAAQLVSTAAHIGRPSSITQP